MTALLDQAFAAAATLSPEEQDALARRIIEEIQRPMAGHLPAIGRLIEDARKDDQILAIDKTLASRYGYEYAKNFAVGRREGLLESIHDMLQAQFGTLGLILFPEISQIASPDRLLEILAFIMTASSPAAVRSAFPEVDYPRTRTGGSE